MATEFHARTHDRLFRVTPTRGHPVTVEILHEHLQKAGENIQKEMRMQMSMMEGRLASKQEALSRQLAEVAALCRVSGQAEGRVA